MRAARIVTLVALAVFLAAAPTFAVSYPVSGKWTYENADEDGPSAECSGRTMEFMDQRRTDTGGSVPDLRNVTVSKTGPTLYRVVDEFFNGMIRGRVYYTLHLVDRDHIEINFDASGTTFLLRRCAG